MLLSAERHGATWALVRVERMGRKGRAGVVRDQRVQSLGDRLDLGVVDVATAVDELDQLDIELRTVPRSALDGVQAPSTGSTRGTPFGALPAVVDTTCAQCGERRPLHRKPMLRALDAAAGSGGRRVYATRRGLVLAL